MQFLSKYGVARHIYLPIVKRAVVDFAVSADWTPAAGDVKISKDGGAAANVTNLPAAITMGNTAMWDFSLTATEMQAAQVMVSVADSATKAVEDQFFIIETYGNASGQHPFDLATATQKVDVDTIKTQSVTCAGGVTVPAATLASTTNITAGTVTTATNVTTVNGLAANVITATSINADAITAAKIADNAIDRATFAADTGLQSVRSNTAQAGANGSITLDASASATDGFYTDAYVYLTGSTGVGQCRLISGYTGASKVATVTPNWSVNPDNTTTFAILPFGRVDVGFWLGAIVNALISGRVDSNTQAIANAVITSSTLAADTLTAAKVASDVTDEIWGKACTEPTAVVGANPTVVQALSWLLTLSRNLITQTATTQTLKADDGSTTIATSAVADDGTTFSRAEWS